MKQNLPSYDDILDFWFAETTKPLWFNSSDEFDQLICEKYLEIYNVAKASKLVVWQENPLGALTLVIILDQFPLNMFRGQSQSFATEAMSRDVATEAINQGYDAELTSEQKAFLYMPYMHSENLKDQEQALILFNQEGLENNLKFAQHHYDIVKKFGRFPHRNRILGRANTKEELKYLNSDEAFLG